MHCFSKIHEYNVESLTLPGNCLEMGCAMTYVRWRSAVQQTTCRARWYCVSHMNSCTACSCLPCHTSDTCTTVCNNVILLEYLLMLHFREMLYSMDWGTECTHSTGVWEVRNWWWLSKHLCPEFCISVLHCAVIISELDSTQRVQTSVKAAHCC